MSFMDNLKARREAKKAAEGKMEEKKVQPIKLAHVKKTVEDPITEPKKAGASILARLKKKKQEANKVPASEPVKEVEAKVEEPKKESLQDRMNAVVKDVMDKKPEEAPEKKEATFSPAVIDDPADKEELKKVLDESNKKAEADEPAAEEEKKPHLEEVEKEPGAAAKEETEASEPEEKKPAKKTRRRRSKKSEEKKEDEAETEEKPAYGERSGIRTSEYTQYFNLFGKKLNYNEMAGVVLDYFEDDEWKEVEKNLTEKMDAIRIEPDMNPGTLKVVLASLNNLYDEAAIVYDDQKKLLDALCDKDFGAAVAYQAVNSVGNNAEERKRNGFLALSNANVGDHKVNYLAMICATRVRYEFIKHLIDRIKTKMNVCITVSGAMKMEQSMVLNS